MPFPANLAAIKAACGWTWRDLGADTGIHPKRLHRLALGQVEVTLAEVVAIARVFDVLPEDLAWMDAPDFARLLPRLVA